MCTDGAETATAAVGAGAEAAIVVVAAGADNYQGKIMLTGGACVADAIEEVNKYGSNRPSWSRPLASYVP